MIQSIDNIQNSGINLQNTHDIRSYDVQHLPIVRAYLEKLRLVEIIDQNLDCDMQASPGRIVVGLIQDVLTGRSPFFRVQEFLRHQDIELIVGADMPLSTFNDTTIGRVLDRLFEYGTQKIFSQISMEAVKAFHLDTSYVHEDTTSVSVWGEYDQSEKSDGPTVTYGHSKDLRPDLKQFVVSLLTIEKNVPIFGKTENGNSSDKKINTQILSTISEYMISHGVSNQEFVYVADSALVTPDNLKILKSMDQSDKIKFISRLPETYNECERVKNQAIQFDSWENIGRLSKEIPTEKRLLAEYKIKDESVEIDQQKYRVLVVHSSLLDKRQQKTIERHIAKDKQEILEICEEIEKIEFQCEADAQKMAEKYQSKSQYHVLEYRVLPQAIYKRGRPKLNAKREVSKTIYRVKYTINENKKSIQHLKNMTGCFVLLTNISQEETIGKTILEKYKDQFGIEQNFGFLKDPLIVNDLFVKNAERIEALGLILLIALLVARLIQRNMRKYIENHSCSITGWDNKKTTTPTFFMMTTKFSSVHVLKQKEYRMLSRPLEDVELEYLKILELKPDIFINIKE